MLASLLSRAAKLALKSRGLAYLIMGQGKLSGGKVVVDGEKSVDAIKLSVGNGGTVISSRLRPTQVHTMASTSYEKLQ